MRERVGAWLDIAPYKQGGRARLSQALLAVNKRRSEPCSRCAARAALDLANAKNLTTGKKNRGPGAPPSGAQLQRESTQPAIKPRSSILLAIPLATRRSEPCSRCAARAALDLANAKTLRQAKKIAGQVPLPLVRSYRGRSTQPAIKPRSSILLAIPLATRRSEPCSRCAARAALDLANAKNLTTGKKNRGPGAPPSGAQLQREKHPTRDQASLVNPSCDTPRQSPRSPCHRPPAGSSPGTTAGRRRRESPVGAPAAQPQWPTPGP